MTPSIIILTLLVSLQAGALQFTAPPAWKARGSASAMRVAEFIVPRTASDKEDAEVIVYYFGGSGGTVDANIERWVGQFKTASGGAVTPPTRTSSSVGTLKVTQIDVSGTYVAEIKPGSPERYNKPNFRMRAAVVETPKGPYFIKLTGPTATVTNAAAGFDQFVKSLKFQ